MKLIDNIIHAKWIITCEDDNKVLENHALAIQAGKIAAVLPSQEVSKSYQAPVETYYHTHAVLPGFINGHTHSAMTLFRGLADDLSLMDWLKNHIWPAETKWVSEEFVYDGSLLAMGEMIRSGTTCFNDMYFFLHDTAKAAEYAGLRGHIGMTVINVPTAYAKTAQEYFEKALQFYQDYHDHPLITPTLAPHSTYAVSNDDLIKIKEIANQYHLKINIHLQEDPAEITQSMQKYQMRPLERLHTLGLVTKDLIAIHMIQINEADLEILKATKPSIVHCPESNMKLASDGACPVEKFHALGLNVALGTDGAASNNDLNMIGEMRSAALLGKNFTVNPKAVPAAMVLKMATINGAKALGIDHLTGSLTPGKAADFIAIQLEEIETQPLYQPISQIVYAASRHQVTDVWVAGKQLMKERQLLTLDEKELIGKAKMWRKKIRGIN